MKYLPFRQIVFSVLLPLLFYVWSVPLCETYFTRIYHDGLDDILLQSDASLLGGEASVVQVIRENISRYVSDHPSFSLFSTYTIEVLTAEGEPIYPFTNSSLSLFTSQQNVALENYRLIKDGLSLEVILYAQPNSPLSVGALCLFGALALGGLFIIYRRQVAHVCEERRGRDQIIVSLMEEGKRSEEAFEALSDRQDTLTRNLENARRSLSISHESQSGMVEEIEVLEALLDENEADRIRQREEMAVLSESIAVHTPVNGSRPGKRKSREKEVTAKRLKTLYKRLRIDDRAVTGFLALEEGMRLKCEALIHQLNDDPSAVIIKRKIFGGKGMDTFFETEFAYKGRLYFMYDPRGKVGILAIGTKNSQATELSFLNRIRGRGGVA